jgi:hypothetical protein
MTVIKALSLVIVTQVLGINILNLSYMNFILMLNL